MGSKRMMPTVELPLSQSIVHAAWRDNTHVQYTHLYTLPNSSQICTYVASLQLYSLYLRYAITVGVLFHIDNGCTQCYREAVCRRSHVAHLALCQTR